MNADQLLEAFELIGDAPQHVQQLRKLVVALAIAGTLTTDAAPSDMTAMLKTIEATKAKLVKAGTISRPKYFPLLSAEQLPESFSDVSLFAPLGTVAQLEKGLTGIQQAVPGEFPLVVTAAERGTCDHFDFVGPAAIVPLVSSTGHGNASINRLHYQDGKFALGSILVAVRPYDPEQISARFIFEYLTAFKEELLVSRMTGSANVTLTLGKLAEVPIPMVSPQLQAKVDELMALLDRLEEVRAGREALRDQLTAASLNRLTQTDPEDFQPAAHFALQTLPHLTTRPDQIKTLRQTILNLAVRGKLVEQDSEDEPASELLNRIATTKSARARAGLIPKKAEPLRDPNWRPDFEPVGWQCVALGQVSDLVTSGSRGWGDFYAPTGPGFVRAQNIRFGRLLLDDLACVQPPTNSEGSRTQVAKDDLLVVITGAGVTNPALLDRDLGEAYVSQHVGLVRPTDASLSPWLLLCLMADAGGRAELVARAYGAGKPGLNLENIRNLTIPLPPLAEQHRIVARVDALMALCDQLEAGLAGAEATRTRLLDALLHAALMPVSEAASRNDHATTG